MLTKLQLFFLLLFVGAPVTVGTVLYSSFVSPDNWIYKGGNTGSVFSYKDGGLHAAPGPAIQTGGVWESMLTPAVALPHKPVPCQGPEPTM